MNAVDVRVTMDKECENKIGKLFLKNYYILFSSFLLEKGEFSRKKRVNRIGRKRVGLNSCLKKSITWARNLDHYFVLF